MRQERLETLMGKVEAYVDEVWPQVVDDIARLVAIRSVEDLGAAAPGVPWGPANREALTCALEIAEKLGLAPCDCEGYIGYADLPGATPTQVATIAHSDVVPEGGGWDTDPFTLTRREGYLLGRGVMDDKGPLVLSLYAAHFFVREVRRTGTPLPYTLRCIIGNDEETTMGDLIWYLEHVGEPDFCFTPDADFPMVNGEKGLYGGAFQSGEVLGDPGSVIVSIEGGTVSNAIPSAAEAVVRTDASALPAAERIEVAAAGEGLVRIAAQGVGGHASMPEGTVNAIGVLVSYLLEQGLCSPDERSFLELQRDLCAVADGSGMGISCADDIFGQLTCVGGVVRTEGRRIVQTVDVRYPTATTGTALTEAFAERARAHGADFSCMRAEEPVYHDPSAPEFAALLDAYRLYYPDRPSDPFVIGGGTYAHHLSNACAFGVFDGRVPLPDWVGMEHGPNEGIAEQDLRQGLKIYIVGIAMLMELDHLGQSEGA